MIFATAPARTFSLCQQIAAHVGMRTFLAAALTASAQALSLARTPVVLRATPPTMTAVASWYDAGSRLTVDDASVPVVADDVVGLPSFFTASMAATSPQLVEKALTYEAEIASKQARLDAFPKQEGTMCGILRDQIKVAKLVLAATVEEAREVEARGAGRREAYYCTDAGCWIAQQYFCDETGCWITDTPAVEPVKGVVAPTNKAAPSAAPEKTIVQEGIFAPAVKLTAQAMGRKELNAFRASVIAKHTKVISAFVDTSESKFGQIALKSMFEAAYVNARSKPACSSALSVHTAPSSHSRAHVRIPNFSQGQGRQRHARQGGSQGGAAGAGLHVRRRQGDQQDLQARGFGQEWCVTSYADSGPSEHLALLTAQR